MAGSSKWWKRLVAFLMDWAILGIPLFLLSFSEPYQQLVPWSAGEVRIGPVSINPNSQPTYLLLLLLALFGPLAYLTFFHGRPRGQSPGKMVVGIRVIDCETGESLTYGLSFLRALFHVMWLGVFLFGLLDGLWSLWDEKGQTWHDKMVGSVVIDLRSAKRSDRGTSH